MLISINVCNIMVFNMKNFIISKFVKNPDDVKNPETRESYGSIAGVVGIVSNLILCTFKIGTGLIFNSISILADGINNMSDAGASIITLIGFKLAGKKPDKDHPYGHGRAEYLTGLLISVLVMAIGVSLLITSVDKTLHPQELDMSLLAIVVLVIAIAIKIWQMTFNVSIGKLIESDALIATGADSRNDVIATSAVLVSTIICFLFKINLDGPVGIIVSGFIIYSGIGLIKETVAPIIGKAPDIELVRDITKMVVAGEYVLGIHDLIVHDYGPGRLFASCHAEVDASLNIFDIHDDIDNIEKEVYEKLNVLLTIHMDPVDLKDPVTAVAKEQLLIIVSKIKGLTGLHDVRAVTGPTHINIVYDIIADFECELSDSEIKEKLQEELKKYNEKYVSVVTIDRKYV